MLQFGWPETKKIGKFVILIVVKASRSEFDGLCFAYKFNLISQSAKQYNEFIDYT